MIKNTRSLFLHESSECHSSKTIKTINSELFFVAENRQNLCKKVRFPFKADLVYPFHSKQFKCLFLMFYCLPSIDIVRIDRF